MNEEENQVGPLVGWVICRLKEESNENQKGSSLSNRIVDLTFGSLSRGDFPPTTSWIFLAKGNVFIIYLYVCQPICAGLYHIQFLIR